MSEINEILVGNLFHKILQIDSDNKETNANIKINWYFTNSNMDKKRWISPYEVEEYILGYIESYKMNEDDDFTITFDSFIWMGISIFTKNKKITKKEIEEYFGNLENENEYDELYRKISHDIFIRLFNFHIHSYEFL